MSHATTGEAFAGSRRRQAFLVRATLVGVDDVRARDHSGRGDRRDGVGRDAVASHLHRDDRRHAGDRRLGGAVVRLSDVSPQSCARRRVDDSTAHRFACFRLRSPIRARMTREREGALHVHLEHRVELGLGHGREHAIAQEPRVVHHRVEAAVTLQDSADERLDPRPIGDRRSVGHRTAATRLDLGHDGLGRRPTGLALAIDADTEIVHHDRGTVPGQFQRVRPSEPSSRARDDGNPTFKV